MTQACKRACQVYQNLEHRGHNIHEENENRVNKLEQTTRDYIEKLASQGKKPIEIIAHLKVWLDEHDHPDPVDSRYWPTHCVIEYLVQRRTQQGRKAEDDAISVSLLVRHDLEGSIVFYQKLSKEHEQPLIIVYQNERQKQALLDHGSMVFLDASFSGLTAYGYPVYSMMIRDNYGRGRPVAYFIMSKDTEECLAIALKALHKANTSWTPRSFMIDKDFKEVAAIERIFNSYCICSAVLVPCLTGSAQMADIESWFSWPTAGRDRKNVINLMIKLKACTEETVFNQTFQGAEISQTARTYIQKNWVTSGKMWANYGRMHCHKNSETNNMVERFFFALKYHFLRGYTNKRIDDLLLLMDGKIQHYYDYVGALQDAGRTSRTTIDNNKVALHAAKDLQARNWDQQITWLQGGKFTVASGSQMNRHWKVDLQELTCDCPSASHEGMCKHTQ